MRTFVYVDGFNLYYGALKGTPWKWLDLPALFAKVLQPHHDILTVKYFTARVSGTPADPSKPQRQDVNLAVHLLNDGWLDAYDCAVVVSNDSDIAEAMRLVRRHHGKRIGLVTPGTGRPSRQLMAHADFARHVRPNALPRSQLPDPIPGANIRKPARWQRVSQVPQSSGSGDRMRRIGTVGALDGSRGPLGDAR